MEAETALAAQLRELEGQRDEYTACVRVLGDLARLRWTLVESGHGLELHSPRPHDARTSAPCEVRRRKDAIRSELRPRVLQQFADRHVRRFIERLERPTASSRHRSIKALIADGAELQDRLRAARGHPVGDPARAEALGDTVRPYLQLVDPGARDTHTGILLRDVWRYFRYTWSIPQTPIPGRSLLYLVRDAAHEHQAVIGIAALNNCAVQMVPRDRTIGWSAPGLAAALTTLFSPADQRRTRQASEPALALQGIYQWLLPLFPAGAEPSPETRRTALERVLEWLLQGISAAIGEIEHRGLVAPEDLASPTQETLDRLRHLTREFAARRQEALARDGDDRDPAPDPAAVGAPVDDDVLNLEAKHASNAPVNNSRRMLVRKKRAFELARLLDASRILTASRDALTDPDSAFATMEREEVRTAINTAMSAIKSQRIGTNLLEITTCGAVAPYNRMLGGKLVALLLLSPQIAADNNRRYGAEPAIIRSQLKNAPVVPDNTLVWLGTTSLFSHGSSQYERLRLPAGTIAPEQEEIRYRYLGETTGYGTVQFADDTVRALDSVMRRRRGYRDVNSVFGEGASPRLRKLRSGLDAIGFNASLTMLHHQGRRIYGVPLFPDAAAYLCGFDPDVPDYIRSPEAREDASERIAEFWRRRWLARRLEHEDSWAALGETGPWLLSATIPNGPAVVSPPQGDDGDGDGDGPEGDQRVDDEAELDFWRSLARAGPNAVFEGLSDDDYARLHLKMPLEDHLLEQARKGRSIVLTGNAGDGKTHLARTLQRRLGDDAARFVFEFDATAVMTSQDGVAPIVDTWRQAVNDGKGMVLAINQYPLHMLRPELRSALPAVSEAIERQWRARLLVEASGEAAEPKDLLLVDLSLRNPLSQQFAKQVLNRMLESPVVRRHAASYADPNFSLNFRCLKHAEVQTRLFDLFRRVVSAGGRATIRELWILCARLLFGTPSDVDIPGSHRAWYSDRLFEPDPRFPLTGALCRIADPAGVSHPQIDRRLEDPRGTRAVDWLIDGEPPDHPASPVAAVAAAASHDRERHRARFAARKRRFYFEHVDGGEQRVFALDDRPHARFHRMLQTDTHDAEYLRDLIEAINRCYIPHDFDGMRDKLCLWIGHRLDEQPTKSFVASECIPLGRLTLRRPAPPAALRDNLDYVPDHLLLNLESPGVGVSQELSLRVDPALFETLWSIKAGLPRHLINPGELNRLDTFIDRLRSSSPAPEPMAEFLIYNAEHVASSAVKLSGDRTRYDEVDRLHPDGRT